MINRVFEKDGKTFKRVSYNKIRAAIRIKGKWSGLVAPYKLDPSDPNTPIKEVIDAITPWDVHTQTKGFARNECYVGTAGEYLAYYQEVTD